MDPPLFKIKAVSFVNHNVQASCSSNLCQSLHNETSAELS